MKNWLIGKAPDAGKDWRHEEKGMAEDKMVGWHHRLNGHGFGWTLGVGDGQGGLACCSPWDLKELDTTEWLNWTDLSGKDCSCCQRCFWVIRARGGAGFWCWQGGDLQVRKVPLQDRSMVPAVWNIDLRRENSGATEVIWNAVAFGRTS